DRDLPAAHRRELGEVVVVEHDHLAVLGLVSLGDVGVVDLLAVEAADALVADPAALLGVHLAEGDVLALGRRIQLHRHADQSVGHRALPYRRHVALLRRVHLASSLSQVGPMRPMLGTRGDRFSAAPPTGAAWLHDVKWDGVRALAAVTERGLVLTSRNENAITAAYPELHGLADALPVGSLLDEIGRASGRERIKMAVHAVSLKT